MRSFLASFSHLIVPLLSTTAKVILVHARPQTDAHGHEHSQQHQHDGYGASFHCQGPGGSKGGVEERQYQQQNGRESELVHGRTGDGFLRVKKLVSSSLAAKRDGVEQDFSALDLGPKAKLQKVQISVR